MSQKDKEAGSSATLGSSEEAGVRELVESCLSSDDVTPLLRLVFTGQPAGAPQDDHLINGKPPLEVLQTCLRSVAAEQESIIHEVCQNNALEIAQCVAEMDALLLAVERVKEVAQPGSGPLQKVGTSLVETARNLHGLLTSQQHLSDAVDAVHMARKLLQRCMQVGQLIEQRKLYQALKLLEVLKAQNMTPLMAMLAGGGGAAPNTSGLSPAAASVSRAQAAASSRKLIGVMKLRSYLQTLVGDLQAAVEYYALSEFNTWLGSVRAEARKIGLRAIRKAAIERQLEEDLGRERKRAMSQLTATRDLSVVASTVAQSTFRKELQAENVPGTPAGSADDTTATKGTNLSRSASKQAAAAATQATQPTPSDLTSLHPGQPLKAIQEVLARHRTQSKVQASQPPEPFTDNTVSLLQGIDMHGLYRCLHVHRCLDQVPRLRQYYLEQRRLQITTDLTPPQQLLEGYQAYLAQVAGFFLVEDTVKTLCGELISGDEAAVLWEAAAGAVKSVLYRALEGQASAAIMLMVKDFVLLVCNALQLRGYATAPITEVLMNSRVRYHELLTATAVARVSQELNQDTLAPYVITTLAQYRDVIGQLGLPAQVEGAGAAPVGGLPLTAPFTASLPAIVGMVREYVLDSISYLRGLYSSWELLPAIFQQRDKMLIKTVVDALVGRLVKLHQPARIKDVMLMVANVWALGQAMDALDEWTVLQVRPLGAVASAAGATAAAAAATASQQQQNGGQPGAHGANGHGNDSEQSPPVSISGAPLGTSSTGAPRYKGLKAAVASEAVVSSIQASLRAVQDSGERSLLRLVSGQVEAMVAAAKTMNWLPTALLPDATSEYVEDLRKFLKSTFDAAHTILPRSSFLFLCRTVVKAISHTYMKLFAPEGIKAFNMVSMQRLAADLAYIQAYADTCPVPNLSQELAEPRQLCALLMSDKVEEILIPELRRQKYPALELGAVVLACDKYRELAKIGRDKTNFLAKRVVDGVAKQLRVQMAAGTASAGPRVLEDI